MGRDAEVLTCRVPPALKTRLREYADRHGVSLNAAVAILLDRALRVEERERPS